MQKVKQTLKLLFRILFGLTFIFSGFVKGIDPLGSSYKFTDYFNAMGLESLLWAAMPLGVILAFGEFMIGVAFLFNWWMKLFAWLGLLFMAFFLPLTLWIAIKNPVTDCGCFGDALHISNWETFYKNIALMLFAIVAFVYRKEMPDVKYRKIATGLSLCIAVVYFGLVNYSYKHLPLIDFRPYKVGVNIPEAMQIPEDAQQEVYETTHYYKNKKSGEIKEFTEQNYPWQDTLNWEWNDTQSVLVQEGYEAPIHDFRIETPDGEDIHDFFVYDESFVFMLIANDLSKTDTIKMKEVNSLAQWAIEQNYSFIGLTSSIPEEYFQFMDIHRCNFEFFNCDEITLKTIIRSNPGLMVLKGGTIIGKWHENDIPTVEEFETEFLSKK